MKKGIFKFTVLMVLAAFTQWVFNYFFGMPEVNGVQEALLLTTLITGAGVQTNVVGQAQLDEYILLGTVDTIMPLQGLTIMVGGKPFIALTNVQTLLAAWSKWRMRAVQGSAVVGLLLRVSTGRISKPTTYQFVNNGATTPNVYVFSDSDNGIPVEAATNTINANSYQIYTTFSALFLQTPANVASLEIVFANGYAVTLTRFEAEAYLTAQMDTEAGGELSGVTVIDNSDQKYRSIKINTTGAALTVMTVQVNQAAWNALNPANQG